MAKVVEDMMENYGFHHRISSVANPHTNTRAELGVKTSKRVLMDIVSAKGLMDRAMVLTSASVDKHSGQRQRAVSTHALYEREPRPGTARMGGHVDEPVGYQGDGSGTQDQIFREEVV
jgi:hypothetical protein